MNQNLDDPKLTAYALGELDEADRAKIETLLSSDPTARQFVEETRAFAAQLEEGLKAAPVPDITAEQKEKISAARERKIVSFPRPVVRGFLIAAALMAVCLVIAGLLFPAIRADKEAAREVLALNVPPSTTRGLSRMTPAVEMPPTETAASAAAQPLLAEAGKSKSREGEQIYDGGATTIQAPPAPATTPASAEQALFYKDANGNKRFEGYINYGSPIVEARPAKPLAAAGGEVAQLQAESSKVERRWQNPVRAFGAAPASAPVPQTATSAPFAGKVDSRAFPPGTEIKDPATGKITIVGDEDQPGGLNTDGFNTEAYDHISDNPFLRAAQNPLSTFSIDVDTASYANVRRFLTSNTLPPKDAVRIEELVNYFAYEYPQPKGEDPFSVNVEVAPAPWNSAHQLARIGLKGREVPPAERTACNLVFLLDVSGSMNEPNKLPLVRESMKMLVERLRPDDRVAIVVYAGASGMVLPSTEVREKAKILKSIDQLRPGGSTNGAAGIQLAYDIAKANFIKGSANRVILCTDGDFNVGVTNQGELVRLIEEKAKIGVFLTVLGFGMGNYKDSMLEKLADKGNGAYGYIDTRREAQKLFVDQLSGTLVTIAKDVKIQIEFNPARVGAYRLIGYENRLLRAEDFNDDKKDAGEIGAGHTVTALYELVPAGHEQDVPGVDALKYVNPPAKPVETGSAEWMTVKLRYKQPDGDVSKLIENPVTPNPEAAPSKDFQFAASVAEFGMLLRESPHKGSSSWDAALELAENGMGADAQGYRHEFVELLRKAKALQPK